MDAMKKDFMDKNIQQWQATLAYREADVQCARDVTYRHLMEIRVAELKARLQTAKLFYVQFGFDWPHAVPMAETGFCCCTAEPCSQPLLCTSCEHFIPELLPIKK